MKHWKNRYKFDQSIILYSAWNGRVYGGSDSNRKIKEVEKGSDGYCPGGDFTLELDLSKRSLVMEIDYERITLDANLGDFQYSPFLRFRLCSEQDAVTLL